MPEFGRFPLFLRRHFGESRKMPSNRTPENLFCESPRNALELLLLSQGAAIAIMTPRSDPLAVVGLIDGLFDLSAPRYSSCFDLQRPRFLTFDRAAELWREGALDGLVLQVNDQLKLGQLPEIELSPVSMP